MPQVLAIDFDSYVEEWGEQEFIRQLRRREVIGMVAYDLDAFEADGTRKILGYMIYVLFKNRIELERLAVDVNHRRAGVATALLDRLKTKLWRNHRTKICLDVHDCLLPTHLLLRKCGFRAVDMLEDAYRFEFHVPQEHESVLT